MNRVRLKSVVRNPVRKAGGSAEPFIGLEDIEGRTGKLLVNKLSLKAAEDSIVHQKGDVLFSKLRPYLAKSYLPLAAGTATAELLVLRPNPSVDPRYLFYATLSHPWLEWANTTAYGTKMPRTSWDLMSEYRLWLPPSEEQRRIVDFLDGETIRIDRLVAARVRQRDVLDERLYADVSETLIPGITRTTSEVWPWMWLPELGHDRPLVRLGYVCRLQTGITMDGGRDAGGDAVTRPYLRVANVQAGHVDLSSVTEVTVPSAMAARSTLRRGDVLMTEGGDLDKLGRGTVWHGELPDCLHQNHVFALRPEIDRLNADYLALMTQTLHGRSYFESTGTKTTNLASTSSSKILSFPVPLPAMHRQRELVGGLRRRLDTAARAQKELARQLELLGERKQALITAAVTGQIEVSTASGRGIED